MNSRHFFILFVTAIFAFTGCYTKLTHHDMPNNHLVFGAEGGSVFYPWDYGLSVRYVDIDGERVSLVGSQVVDTLSIETYDWVQFARKTGYPSLGLYKFAVQPNPSTKPRSAVVHLKVAVKWYGEMYITQEGRKVLDKGAEYEPSDSDTSHYEF